MTARTGKWAAALVSVAALGSVGPAEVDSPSMAATVARGPALTPPMGWSNWDAFAPEIVTQRHIHAITNKMVALHLRDVGYRYVVVGAGWQAMTRTARGEMRADPTKFPSGMRALAAYVHRRGFDFGVQVAPGRRNCQAWPNPGTVTAPGRSYAEKARFDARTLARWGVDFMRLDGCYYQESRPAGLTFREWAARVYGGWARALEATGRDIVFWGNGGHSTPELWGRLGVHVWRVKRDLHPCWSEVLEGLDVDARLTSLAGPGHWNDPDFLVGGTSRPEFVRRCATGALTGVETRAQISLWAELAAPLFLSTDLRVDSRATIRSLTNRDVIAVDQDRAGRQGHRVRTNGRQEVWTRPLADGDRAVVLFNRATGKALITTSAESVGMPAASRYYLHHLWGHCVTSTSGRISATVTGHGVSMTRVSLERRRGWPRCT